MARDQAKEAASRHQETTSRSQKHTPASDRKPSQAIHIQKQSYPGSAGTSLPLQQATSLRAGKYVSSLPLLPHRCADLIEATQRPQILYKPSTSSRKRKRGQGEEAGHLSSRIREQPPSKRPQIPPPSCTAEVELKKKKKKKKKEERKKESTSDIIVKTADPLEYWTLTKRWPKEYFEQHSQIKEDPEQDSWLEEQMESPIQDIKYVEVNGFRLPCPIRKAPTSVRRKQSDSSLNSSGDQTNREKKSAPYRAVRYTTLLEGKGSYMYKSDLGITKGSKDLYSRLLGLEQAVPMDLLFRDDLFEKTCRKIEDRNEARVIQDIARLIKLFATYGATQLDRLIEGVNEGWTGNIAVEGPLPKPDCSVGFRRSAFSDEQLKKLDKLIGSVFENSLFVATYRTYFPFFTCEVKCGAAALDVADRQNAHSMTVSVRALVELFRSVKREEELDREILAFSVSHDHRSVRIYGHYPVIEGDKTTYYRHPIREFSFTEQDGKEKWTAYKFVKNVYDHHSLKLHKMICSGIDDLPGGINFDLSQSASFSQSTPQSSQQSNAESILGEDDSQSSLLASQEATPTTSFTPTTERASKKPRNQRATDQRC
ncbi:MAG: hypothetical protein L6R40_008447 [Gallowayella cf. fulva]|nr:MAG: hypothetical protein L6R40_008447 [Xanthomendoza cf. fulva]